MIAHRKAETEQKKKIINVHVTNIIPTSYYYAVNITIIIISYLISYTYNHYNKNYNNYDKSFKITQNFWLILQHYS